MNATAPNRCLALSYQWHLPRQDFTDFDASLVVSRCESLGASVGICAAPGAAQVKRYHAKLPPKRQVGKLSDVSGTLGLAFPIADEAGQQIASAFERLVADVILWELAAFEFGSQRTIVLLQGPLLPKLRGRLLYRGIAENVSIYALTHRPKSFNALEAAEQMALNHESEKGLTPIYPPKGIDRATRSWVWQTQEEPPIHIETVTNTWSSSFRPEWETERKDEIEWIMRPDGVEFLPKESVSLPVALARALQAAEAGRENEVRFVRFLQNLRKVDHDPSRLDDDESKAVVAYLTKANTQGSAIPDPKLVASPVGSLDSRAPVQVDYSNEAEIYELISNIPGGALDDKFRAVGPPKVDPEDELVARLGAGLRRQSEFASLSTNATDADIEKASREFQLRIMSLKRSTPKKGFQASANGVKRSSQAVIDKFRELMSFDNSEVSGDERFKTLVTRAQQLAPPSWNRLASELDRFKPETAIEFNSLTAAQQAELFYSLEKMLAECENDDNGNRTE